MTSLYHLPNAFQTARFNLRRVVEGDAPALFEAYTTDAEVTRYLGWRPHLCVDETAKFLGSGPINPAPSAAISLNFSGLGRAANSGSICKRPKTLK